MFTVDNSDSQTDCDVICSKLHFHHCDIFELIIMFLLLIFLVIVCFAACMISCQRNMLKSKELKRKFLWCVLNSCFWFLFYPSKNYIIVFFQFNIFNYCSLQRQAWHLFCQKSHIWSFYFHLWIVIFVKGNMIDGCVKRTSQWWS